MLNKKDQRIRRSRQTRARIAIQRSARLTVFRSNLHIYATVISDDGARVVATASTAEADVRKELGAAGKGGNVAAAALIGKRIAETGEGGRRREGGVRPGGLRLSRPRQGPGGSGSRSRPAVLNVTHAHKRLRDSVAPSDQGFR